MAQLQMSLMPTLPWMVGKSSAMMRRPCSDSLRWRELACLESLASELGD